jgi:hypothetical protein
MFPTFRAPEAKEPTGDPMDEPVRCVMRAGRVDVPMAASKSRRAWSLPSQRREVGFHFMSPTTLGPVDPPKCRINVGFLLVVLFIGEDASFFFFLTETSVIFLTDGKSMRPVRLSTFVEEVRGESAGHPSGPSFLPFFRTVLLSPANFDDE